MTTPKLSELHHVALLATDLDSVTAWFETVFGAVRDAELDHHDQNGNRFAVVLSVPGVTPQILLRLTDKAPEASQFALGVADRDELALWSEHFDGHAVEHSDILTGRVGHVMTCNVPNGSTLLLYAAQH